MARRRKTGFLLFCVRTPHRAAVGWCFGLLKEDRVGLQPPDLKATCRGGLKIPAKASSLLPQGRPRRINVDNKELET